MKKLSTLSAVILAVAEANAAAVLEQVIVRQQWPWSTDIKVEYKISGIEEGSPVDIKVQAYNGGVPLDSPTLKSAITGNLYGISSNGIGSFTIDPVGAFGSAPIALANFKVKLTLSASHGADEVIYKIFDLTAASGTFPCTDVTRADIMNNLYGTWETNYANVVSGAATPIDDCLIWTGVTNYPGAKTTKLVMRKVSAKGETWRMGQAGGNFSGSTNAEKVHDVTLTKNYFIGVYPVTQEQYRKLTRGAWSGSGHQGEANPVESATYAVFQSVVTNGIAKNLGVPVNYPTEAQWEFACRAGTTSELYTGLPLNSANLNPIAWHSGNSGNNTCEVGLKLPNAFGLYDMLGNVYEACRDAYKDSSVAVGYKDGAAVTDPEEDGPASEEKYVMRGGSFALNNIMTTSAGRNGATGNWTAYGFRISFEIDE